MKIKVDPLHKVANIESDEGHKTPRGEIWTTSTRIWLPCSLARMKLTTHRLPANTSSATSANPSAPLFFLLRSELQAAHSGLICFQVPACSPLMPWVLTLIHNVQRLLQWHTGQRLLPINSRGRSGWGFALGFNHPNRIKISIKSTYYIYLILLVFLYLFDFIGFFK